MDFDLSEDQRAIVGAVRDCVRRAPAPSVADLAAVGLLGLLGPADLGGMDGSLEDACLCLEELGAVHPSLGVLVLNHAVLAVRGLMTLGSAEQRARHLPELVSGARLATVARTTDGVVARGVPFGTEARVVLVLTPEAAEVATGPLAVATELRVLGLREARPVDLSLTGADIEPLSADLGPLVELEDLGLAALLVGLGRGALERAIQYSGERVQFGRPIREFQGIQWKLADAATALDAARLLVLRAAGTLGERPAGAGQARLAALDAALLATDQALQIHGGYGYVAEFGVERLYRDARALAVWDDGRDGLLARIAGELLGGEES